LAEEDSSAAAARTALDWFRAQHAGTAALRAGAAVRVARLDDPARGYLLVPIRDDAGLHGIVQVDSQTGQVETSARIADPSAAFLLPQAQAVAIARSARPQISDWGMPYLGWRPCKESFDGIRPFWVTPHGERVIYVDQSGRVYDDLTLSGRGG
jgi:hypothetical protein